MAPQNPSVSSDEGAASSWIDRHCDQFERDWREGLNPRIEDVLSHLPSELQSAALRELLAVELELRLRRGDQPRQDDYRHRFPTEILDELRPLFVADVEPTKTLGEPGLLPDSTTTTSRYRNLRFYRRGGLGSLYLAHDESLHRDTVVKFMNEQCEADPELIAQFKIEAEVTSRLDHPGIVPVYGIGQDWLGRPFYVMRLIHGRELKDAIREYHEARGPAPHDPRQRQTLFTLLEHLASACNTVAYAHHAGIVHCDLKPANIMIGKYGETFVLDWGLATTFERSSTFLAPNEATVRPHSAPNDSTSGRRGGTYGYISPEQLIGDGAIGPPADIYSLGATLFEILTGQSPFNGHDPDVREKIRLGRFPSPRTIQPATCPRLEAICQKAMRLDPAQRYATAKRLADDLSCWMRDDEIAAKPDRFLDRLARFGRRHRGLTAAALVTLFTILLALGWSDRTRKTADHEKALRQKSEELRAIQEKAYAAEKVSLTTALDTFEDLCRPLANGEMSNLGVFRPLVDKIRNFTAVYLQNFEDAESMQLHTARVYELRGTVSRVYSSDTAQAAEDLLRAESLYKTLPINSSDRAQHERRLANVWLSQGRLFLQRDEFPQAQRALESAASILLTLRKQQSTDTTLMRLLAEAYHGLGEVQLDRPAEGANRSQALLDAETNFNQSKLLREELVRITVGEENRNHRRDLARSLGYLGDLYLAQGDIPRAAEAYEESKKLRKALFDANPRDPEARFQYARGLANFGELERSYRGRFDQAIEQLLRAESIQRELVSDFDEVENFWIDLGSTELLLADLCLIAALDQPDQAHAMHDRCRAALAEAEKVYGRLSRQARPRGLRGLAQQAVIAAVLKRDSDPNESQKLARQAVEWLETIGREPLLSSSELVTLAMARSLLDQRDTAFRALHAAVERGENSAFRFERHARLAFKSLADDPVYGPRYQELLRQLRDSLKSE